MLPLLLVVIDEREIRLPWDRQRGRGITLPSRKTAVALARDRDDGKVDVIRDRLVRDDPIRHAGGALAELLRQNRGDHGKRAVRPLDLTLRIRGAAVTDHQGLEILSL